MWRDTRPRSSEWTSPTRRPSSSRPASPGEPTWDNGREASAREPGAGLLALELPEGVAGDPSSGCGRPVEDPARFLDGGAVEGAVPFADLSQRPRHCLLDLVAGVVRRAPDQAQVGEELAVGRVLRPHGASRDHRERAALHESLGSPGPGADRG